MIKEVTMYTVFCDRCGKDAFENSSDFVAFSDQESAVTVAKEGGFEQVTKPDGTDAIVCQECWTWSDDEESIVMKPPQVKQ